MRRGEEPPEATSDRWGICFTHWMGETNQECCDENGRIRFYSVRPVRGTSQMGGPDPIPDPLLNGSQLGGREGRSRGNDTCGTLWAPSMEEGPGRRGERSWGEEGVRRTTSTGWNGGEGAGPRPGDERTDPPRGVHGGPGFLSRRHVMALATHFAQTWYPACLSGPGGSSGPHLVGWSNPRDGNAAGAWAATGGAAFGGGRSGGAGATAAGGPARGPAEGGSGEGVGRGCQEARRPARGEDSGPFRGKAFRCPTGR